MLVAVVGVEVVSSMMMLDSCVLVLIFVNVATMKEGKVYSAVVEFRWLGMLHEIGSLG